MNGPPESRPKTDKRKAPRSAWRPGQSGNPGGRPRKTPEQREIEELARRYSPDAIKRLRQIALNGRDNDAVRACEAILDRAWGRNRVEVASKGSFTVTVLPNESREPTPSQLASDAVVDVESQPDSVPDSTESSALSSTPTNGRGYE